MTDGPDSTSPQDAAESELPELDEVAAADAAADWASSDAETAVGEVLGIGSDSRGPKSPAPLEPISGWMLRVALALIIVLLATTASLVFFLLTLHKAPRYVAERDLSAAESAVKERPGDAESWTKYVYALSQTRRYSEAIAAARKGRNLTKADALLLAEADVLREAGRFKEAVDAYNRAGTAIEAAQAEVLAARKKMGIFVPLKDATMVRVYYGRAVARHALGDVRIAIPDLEKAVVMAPEQAYLFVTLGDYYAELSQTVKAEAAYRNALRYVPDYPEALAGLKKLTGGK